MGTFFGFLGTFWGWKGRLPGEGGGRRPGLGGRAGEGLLSKDSVESIGRALASILHDREDFPLDIAPQRGAAVYIGRDTRESGADLLGQLSRGFLSAGLDVCDLGILPTPGIAELARSSEECCLAIVLSASHNPACDNGIKLISPAGSKVSDEFEEEVSRRFDSAVSAESPQSGSHRDLSEAAFERYVNFLVSSSGGGLEGRKVFLDAADGHRAVAGELDHAIAFAQAILRADAAADFGHGGSACRQVVGFAQAAFRGQAQPVGNVIVQRAMRLAVGHAALRAAARLALRLFVRERRADLQEVGATAFGVALGRIGLLALDEFIG